MCEGSIHVANRRATDSEELITRKIPSHGIVGYYPADASAKDQRLVCVVRSQAVLDKVEFRQDILMHFGGKHAYAELNGKTNVKALLVHRHYEDEVVIDDMPIPLNYLKPGMRVRIPPTKVGIDAVNAAIDEAVKTNPVGRALSMTANAVRKRMARAKAKA